MSPVGFPFFGPAIDDRPPGLDPPGMGQAFSGTRHCQVTVRQGCRNVGDAEGHQSHSYCFNLSYRLEAF